MVGIIEAQRTVRIRATLPLLKSICKTSRSEPWTWALVHLLWGILLREDGSDAPEEGEILEVQQATRKKYPGAWAKANPTFHRENVPVGWDHIEGHVGLLLREGVLGEGIPELLRAIGWNDGTPGVVRAAESFGHSVRTVWGRVRRVWKVYTMGGIGTDELVGALQEILGGTE